MAWLQLIPSSCLFFSARARLMFMFPRLSQSTRFFAPVSTVSHHRLGIQRDIVPPPHIHVNLSMYTIFLDVMSLSHTAPLDSFSISSWLPAHCSAGRSKSSHSRCESGTRQLSFAFIRAARWHYFLIQMETCLFLGTDKLSSCYHLTCDVQSQNDSLSSRVSNPISVYPSSTEVLS